MEVYRAWDGTLHRDVALKILPDRFALDVDRLSPFRREAQVLASLDHPNIAAIYGFEESTAIQALVLELVDGPTLAQRIAEGPIALDEAMPIARQIAEALQAAHEHGVVHRDLKPANIKRQQISVGGGSRPVWSQDRQELFFSSPDGRPMLAAPMQLGSALVAGTPEVLFEFDMLAPATGNRPYDVDGRPVRGDSQRPRRRRPRHRR
jgi:serine/threonine protein kinase